MLNDLFWLFWSESSLALFEARGATVTHAVEMRTVYGKGERSYTNRIPSSLISILHNHIGDGILCHPARVTS